MPDLPADPMPEEFRETADRSQAANIAEESGSYVNAVGARPGSEDDTVLPQDGASAGDDAAALVKPDNSPDDSDSIEPFHIPGSAEDIHVAGETGPGPSG